MITYYIGDAEVEAYAKDFVKRLTARAFPSVVVTLGQSGENIAVLITRFIPKEHRGKLRFVRAVCDRTNNNTVTFLDDFGTADLSSGRVLVIDSAIHSGATMLAACEQLASLGATNVISYSLVLKRNSGFVPTFFGVLIADEDRAYFQLQELPNNRLMTGEAPFGYIRPVRESDYSRSEMEIGVNSVETKFGELLYESKARRTSVYLYINSAEVCGYICFYIRDKRLIINTVAVVTNFRGKGVGTALIRWAETFARSTRCEMVELWAINGKIDFYEEMGFVATTGRFIKYDEHTTFTYMFRKMLYNTKEHSMNIL